MSTKRNFLSISELRTLESTEYPPNDIVRRAFIFSCYTGLRLGDIRSLVWGDWHEGYVHSQISKTTRQNRFLVPLLAIPYICPYFGESSPENYPEFLQAYASTHPTERIFPLPSYAVIRRAIPAWVRSAGIRKHITFHCARHTFAAMHITLGTDIYVLSNLLGHANVSTTQIYAKIIDEKKDAAMRRLDE